MRWIIAVAVAVAMASGLRGEAVGWSNGPDGNANTNIASECTNPPYTTHDWVAEHALLLLPENERAWLMPHLTMYLLGTEAPDNDDIPASCGAAKARWHTAQ